MATERGQSACLRGFERQAGLSTQAKACGYPENNPVYRIFTSLVMQSSIVHGLFVLFILLVLPGSIIRAQELVSETQEHSRSEEVSSTADTSTTLSASTSAVKPEEHSRSEESSLRADTSTTLSASTSAVLKAPGNQTTKPEETAATEPERITLDLKGVDIQELFKMLSSKSGFTIITTAEVQKRVTVFLNNLTFEDALDVILTSQDLACERKDNLIKVMTASEYEKNFGEKFGQRKETKTIRLKFAKPADVLKIISSLKSGIGKIIVDETSGTILLMDNPQGLALMEETIKELDQPLETVVFDINYAKAQDIKAYLNELITPGLGQVIIDERSAKAIVSDLAERLAKIKRLMQELDEAARQVLISGEIIQVNLKDKFQRGVDWEKVLSEKKFHSLDFVGKFPASAALSSYEKVSIGTLSQDDYSLVLSLLQEYGDTQVVSRPRLVVVNGQEAKILVGTREAYITQTLSQAQTTTVTSEAVQFVDVGVKLMVSPTINKEGFITIKIKPEVSSVKEIITTSLGSRIPVIQTAEAETTVKVKDNAMIMIAGLLEEKDNNSIAGLPGVSRVPLAGTLFGSRTKEKTRSELIVFLKPQLLSGELEREESRIE